MSTSTQMSLLSSFAVFISSFLHAMEMPPAPPLRRVATDYELLESGEGDAASRLDPESIATRALTLDDSSELRDFLLAPHQRSHLQNNARLQSVFIESLIPPGGPRVDSGGCMFQEALKRVASYNGFSALLRRMIVEGAPYLDVATMFASLEASTRINDQAMQAIIREAILYGIREEQPAAFKPAIIESIRRHDADLAIALWQQADPAQRNPELLNSIFEISCQHADSACMLRLVAAFPFYESQPMLSSTAKRFACATSKAQQIAGALARACSTQPTKKFMMAHLQYFFENLIEDPNNPFFLREHVDLLQKHLVKKLEAGELSCSLSAISQETWAWINYLKSYHLPPRMATSSRS